MSNVNILREDDDLSLNFNTGANGNDISLEKDDINFFDEPEDMGGNDYNQNNTYNDYSNTYAETEETKSKKAHLLWKYKKLNVDSKYSPLVLDMDSDLSLIENEVYRIKKQQDNENGAQIIKNGYVTLISGMEFLSKRQKMIDLDLNGWSTKIQVDSKNPDYEKCFEEIYEQYFSHVSMGPIPTLLFLTIMSGVSVHASNKIFNTGSSAGKSYNRKEKEEEEEESDDLDDIIAKMKANVNDDDKDSNFSFTDVRDDDNVSEIIVEKDKKKRGRKKKNALVI
jgi:hypothetical protein